MLTAKFDFRLKQEVVNGCLLPKCKSVQNATAKTSKINQNFFIISSSNYLLTSIYLYIKVITHKYMEDLCLKTVSLAPKKWL